MFPEIDYDKAAEIWGMDIIVCTTARNDDEARALLTRFQFPVPAVRLKATADAEGQETDGEEEFDREEQPAAQLAKKFAGQARRAQGDRAATRRRPMEERFAAR